MDERIYLDTYLLQQDMRVRLPKSVILRIQGLKKEKQSLIFIWTQESIPLRYLESTMRRSLKMSKKLIAVSLFTGAGGMDVGFERPGIKVEVLSHEYGKRLNLSNT